MRPKALQRIAFMRTETDELRMQSHLALCTCCQDDLDLVDEDPLCRAADDLLNRVRVRCGLAARKRDDE